jgi:hypothetical protein
MKSTVEYYRVDRRQISFIKFILEAYDNTAVITTLDPHRAIVQVTIAPGCERAVHDVLNGFSHEFEVVALDGPTEPANNFESPIVGERDPFVDYEKKKAPH